MRRRRTADAPPTETASESTTETASLLATDTVSAVPESADTPNSPGSVAAPSVEEAKATTENPDTPAPKSRRRASPRRKTDSGDDTGQTSSTSAASEVSEVATGEATEPAPKRASRRRTPKTAEANPSEPTATQSEPSAQSASEPESQTVQATTDAAPIEVLEPSDDQPYPNDAQEAQMDTDTVEVLPDVEMVVPAETGGASGDEPIANASDSTDEETAETEADDSDTTNGEETETVDGTETVGASSRRKRSRRRKGRGQSNQAGEGAGGETGSASPSVAQATDTLQEILGLASPSMPASTVPAVAASPPPVPTTTPVAPVVSSQPVEDANRRTRGLRRAPASRTAALDDTAELQVTEQAVQSEADDLASRRVRGVRRPVVRRILGKPSEANVAATAPVAEGPTVAPPHTIPPPQPAGYQPLPIETLSRLAEGRVERIAGVPELIINGEPRVPLWFFVNTVTTENPDALETAARQIRMAYESGVRFFTALAHLPWRGKSGERRYGSLDETLRLIADNAPEAFILPRLIFSPPPSWERTHENELAQSHDGETGDVSLSSRLFWEDEAVSALRATVEYVAQGNHAGRVFGFYLEHGEWFTDKTRPYDTSEAGQNGFRAWLRTRYANGGNVALRAAWNDGQVTFDTAHVPSWPPPQGPTQFLSSRDGRWSDYHEFLSDQTATVITRLARIAKEASGNRSIVAVSYGYTLELARAASGHLSLAQVLASPHIDILTGPVSYTGRMPGGSAPLPTPIDSVLLAGKLWVSEDDTKTFRATEGGETPDTYNPLISTPEGTFAVHARNFGAALSRGAGVSWMDLFGEGWLDDREIWARIGRLQQTAETVAVLRREGVAPPPVPDVAVLVDERSYFGVRNDDLLQTLVANGRDTLLRSGARVGFYLLSDLLNPQFPQAKLLVFVNAFRVSYPIREALRTRFQNDGRTFAFVYAPGALEENASELTDVLGMHLRLQPWGSKTGTQILSSVHSPLTDLLKGQRIGEERRVNPSYYAADSRAEVLGEYVGTGNPSVAVRRHDGWQSVFLGETDLPLPLLRGLYKLANIPVYTVDDDVAWIGDHLLCLHSAPGGGTTVYLPEAGALADLLTGEALAEGGYGARLSLPPRGTRLLFWGTPEALGRFGIETVNAGQGLTVEELPFSLTPLKPVTAPPSGRREPVRFQVNPNDDALLAAALLDDALFRDKDAGDTDEDENENSDPDTVTTEATGDSNSRKRRRRRRKGRRDNETPVTEETGEADSDDEPAEGEFTGSEFTEDDSDNRDDFEPISFDEAGEASDTPEEPNKAEEAEETEPGVSRLGDPVETAVENAQSQPVPASRAEPEPFLPYVPATVFPDAFLPDIPAATRGSRPSLDELLPLSQILSDQALPPVPDELLPLDMSAFTGGDTGEGETSENAEPRTRRRRPARRRGQGTSAGGTEPESGE